MFYLQGWWLNMNPIHMNRQVFFPFWNMWAKRASKLRSFATLKLFVPIQRSSLNVGSETTVAAIRSNCVFLSSSDWNNNKNLSSYLKSMLHSEQSRCKTNKTNTKALSFDSFHTKAKAPLAHSGNMNTN